MAQLRPRRGDTFDYAATVTETDGSAHDLTGETLWFTMKVNRTDPDSAAVATAYWIDGGASSGLSVATPSTGGFRLQFAASVTANWSAEATYVYDVQVKSATGLITTVDEGTVTIRGDITQRTTTP